MLFAEYYHPKMLYALLGYAARELDSKIEITVVSTIVDAETVKAVINMCNPKLLGMVRFFSLPVKSKNWFSTALRNEIRDGFDYIEYNGGMSIDDEYLLHLKDLSSVLFDKII